MNSLTVALFSHREIEDLRLLEHRLVPIVSELLRENAYVGFLLGRNGEFDEYAASVIKGVQRQHGKECCELSLVLPYTVSDIQYYEKYYDSIIIPECVYRTHPKAAITLRNRWMIEQSDLIIFYVQNQKGGAYSSMKYAEKLNKQRINLFSSGVQSERRLPV